MNVFLTPDLAPFFGGTYFPPADVQGRPGFGTVLTRIAQVWGQRKEEIRESSEDVLRQLGELSSQQPAAGGLPASAQEAAIQVGPLHARPWVDCVL